MKIAFLSLNRELLPEPVMPLGLLYVMANTPPEHTRELWDLCFEADPVAATRTRIRSFEPDLIAIGMRNVQNNDYSGCETNLRYYAEVFRAIRETTRATLVLGGGGFSVMPRELMTLLEPDYGISGEGERAFAELVQVLAGRGGRLEQIGNLHYFEGKQLRSTPARPDFQALDALLPPDRSVVDARYYEQCGTVSIQTKRGCPLQCSYCTYPSVEGDRTRQRAPERVVDELFEARARHDTKHFFLVDSVFNLPREHAKAVCREMIARGFDTPWTCYANPIAYDGELAELMARAGCAGMEVGSDSGVDAILTKLRKGFKTSHIRALHQHAVRAGIPDCHTFILGTPGETLDTVRQTLDFCAELSPFAAIMMIWTDDREALDPALAAQRQAFREEIKQLIRDKQADFPRWIIPPLGINFDPAMFGALRRAGRTGPLWQHLHRVGSSPLRSRAGRRPRTQPENGG